MTIAQLRRTMSHREFVRWQRYWTEEPWGPLRDNLHAAIIARAALMPYLKKGKTLGLDDFLIMHPEDRSARNRKKANAELVGLLRSIAGTPQRRKKRKKLKINPRALAKAKADRKGKE